MLKITNKELPPEGVPVVCIYHTGAWYKGFWKYAENIFDENKRQRRWYMDGIIPVPDTFATCDDWKVPTPDYWMEVSV